MSNLQPRRVLVRWNDDHDKELLLWIVWCCNEAGIKIPYEKVAHYMGNNFTEGAIVQHLAKIRNKMEDAGLHVPRTARRGAVSRTPSKTYGRNKQAPNPYQIEPSGNTSGGQNTSQQQYAGTAMPRSGQASSTSQSRGAKRERDIKKEYNDSDANVDDDRDSDYGATNVKRRRLSSKTVSMPTRQRRDATPSLDTPRPQGNHPGSMQRGGNPFNSTYHGSPGLQIPSARPQSRAGQSGPAKRTRGVRADYANMDLPNSEDEEAEDEYNPAASQSSFGNQQRQSSNASLQNGVAMEHPSTPTYNPQHHQYSAPEQRFDSTFGNFDFPSTSRMSDMAPPTQTTFNPVSTPHNPYAMSFNEPVSRVDSFASASTNNDASVEGHPSWIPDKMERQTRFSNTFGAHYAADTMGFLEHNPGLQSYLLPQLNLEDEGFSANDLRMNTGDDFGLPSLPPDHGLANLPPVDPSALDFDLDTYHRGSN